MIPRAMLACTRRGRGFIYSGNDSGKAGELSKLAAVFPPVDKKQKQQQKRGIKKMNNKDKIFSAEKVIEKEKELKKYPERDRVKTVNAMAKAMILKT